MLKVKLQSTRRLLRSTVLSVGAALVATLLVAPAAHADGEASFTGQGWGHGRGMGQWGARGYAVDHGWTARQILDHFYRGTTASAVGNPVTTVLLAAQANRDLIAAGTNLTVEGASVGSGRSVLVRRVGSGLQVFTAPGCGGPWTSFGGVRSGAVEVRPAAGTLIELCTPQGRRGYHGGLRAVDTGSSIQTVNVVRLDDYLRGVVPAEMPASWGDLGEGRGMQALMAQAVAARSYALSSQYRPYAQTCDTTTCQVYGGVWAGHAGNVLEDPRTSQAVSATSGQVRRFQSGAIARTEFSSSTGGWSAGGQFPAVEDRGDATAGNPHRAWSATLALSTVTARLGTGAEVVGLRVIARNGLGDRGGRVTQVEIRTATGTTQMSGADVRARLGLKSDWFSVSTIDRGEAERYVSALYLDLLGRPADAGGLKSWTDQLVGGSSRAHIAFGVAASPERYGMILERLYQQAFDRSLDPAGRGTWVHALAGPATYNDVAAKIYGSPESFQVMSGGDLQVWVDALYRRVLGRPVDSAGLQTWSAHARAHGLSATAYRVLTSPEATGTRLGQYYGDLLGRAVDPAGRSTYQPLLRANGDVTVPVLIASSPEYWNRAQSR